MCRRRDVPSERIQIQTRWGVRGNHPTVATVGSVGADLSGAVGFCQLTQKFPHPYKAAGTILQIPALLSRLS